MDTVNFKICRLTSAEIFLSFFSSLSEVSFPNSFVSKIVIFFIQNVVEFHTKKFSIHSLGYGMNDRRFESRQRLGIFFLPHSVQSGSGVHPASYPMGTRDSFPGVNRTGCEPYHSPTSSAKIKNAWSYTSIPLRGVVLS
jgi:hypothetical protein